MANPFTSGQSLWKEHENFITYTARSISRSYVKVEEEDVLQEISIFLWEKEKYFIEGGYSEAYIRKSIKNVARNYALKVRDTTLLETDTFYYSLEEVKELLPHLLSVYESWNTAKMVNHGSEAYDSRESMTMMCDFSVAFEKLPDSMKDIIIRRYGEGEELTEPKDRQQASRAVKKLFLTLNAETNKKANKYEGPGSRKAMTNQKGVYLTKLDRDR